MRWFRAACGVGVLVTAGLGCLRLRRWFAGVAALPEEYAEYWRRRAAREGQFLYLAMGDSLSQGLAARRPELGFVGRLAAAVEANLPGQRVAVRNVSVSGATVGDLVADQLPQLERLLRGQEVPDLVTVCIGTNDVTTSSPERFRIQFRQLCARLPAGALVADVPTIAHGPDSEPAAVLAAICREVLAEFPTLVAVRLQRATAGLRFWEMGRDMLHPGTRGHRRYAAAFRAALATPNRALPARLAGLRRLR